MPRAHTYEVRFRIGETEITEVTYVDVTRNGFDTMNEHRKKIIKLAMRKLINQGSDENALSWATVKVRHSGCACQSDTY